MESVEGKRATSWVESRREWLFPFLWKGYWKERRKELRDWGRQRRKKERNYNLEIRSQNRNIDEVGGFHLGCNFVIVQIKDGNRERKQFLEYMAVMEGISTAIPIRIIWFSIVWCKHFWIPEESYPCAKLLATISSNRSFRNLTFRNTVLSKKEMFNILALSQGYSLCIPLFLHPENLLY